jgi:hypothetical protein
VISFRLKALAWALAFLTFLLCLVAPLCIHGLASGAALSDDVPSFGIWLLVLGGALGAGAAHLVLRVVMIRFGRATEADVAAMIEGKR